MGVQLLLQKARAAPLVVSLILAGLIVATLLALPQIVRGFTLGIAITTTPAEFEAGDAVPFQITITLAEDEMGPATFDLTAGGPMEYAFTDIPVAVGSFGPITENNATLNGNITETDVVFEGGYGYGATTGSRITIAGTLRLPTNAPSGTYTLRVDADSEHRTTSFTVERDVVEPKPTPSAPGKTSPLFSIPLKTAIHLQGACLTPHFRNALGVGDVNILDGNGTIIRTDEDVLALRIPGLRLAAAMTFSGPMKFTCGGVKLDTVDGKGTLTLDMGNGVTIHSGDVTLVTRAGRVEVEFGTRMRVEAPAPDADLLLGGDATVTILQALFDVGLLNLPSGSSLDVQYARDPSDLQPNAATVFSGVARDKGATFHIGDLAYVVAITPHTITNSDLGDNKVTLLVNASWVQSRQAAGKHILIVKVDDAGNVHAEAATCTPAAGNAMACEVTFTGAAGGFSTFSLIAVEEEEVVTPTPTPTPTVVPPTPTPTPTVVPPAPTPTPEPPDEPTGALWIIIVVVLVVLASGAGAFFFLRRRPAPEG